MGRRGTCSIACALIGLILKGRFPGTPAPPLCLCKGAKQEVRGPEQPPIGDAAPHAEALITGLDMQPLDLWTLHSCLALVHTSGDRHLTSELVSALWKCSGTEGLSSSQGMLATCVGTSVTHKYPHSDVEHLALALNLGSRHGDKKRILYQPYFSSDSLSLYSFLLLLLSIETLMSGISVCFHMSNSLLTEPSISRIILINS